MFIFRSCSKKLESLNSLGKIDEIKIKKIGKDSASATKSQPIEENNIEDDNQKMMKKKRIKFKRQKGGNNNISPDDTTTTKNNEQIDSLKLYGIAKLPNKQQGKTKIDINTKKKFKRSGIVATAGIHVAKLKNNKIIIDNFSDSSSSDDLPTISNNNNNNNRPRTNKKKKKINVQKKRAFSANFLLSDKS